MRMKIIQKAKALAYHPHLALKGGLLQTEVLGT